MAVVTIVVRSLLPIAGALLLLSGCTSLQSILPGSKPTKVSTTIDPDKKKPEFKRISAAGGTRIAVLVNDAAITNNDIKRRAAFVKLRRMKGNPTAIAKKELIEEAIKMREAKRLGAVVTKEAVDKAYVSFAKRNKMPVKVLTQVLNQRGVTPNGFKQFIRANMSWQRAVGARVRSEGRGGNKGPQVTPKWLLPKQEGSALEKEFLLQQVVFTVPASKRTALLGARKAEARQFRTRIKGCKTTEELASKLNDVAVLNRGRIRTSRLPPNWRKAVLRTPAGQATPVQETAKGAEMLIVCRTRDVKSTAVNSDGSDAFSQEEFQKKAGAIEKKYLAELTKRAVVKER